MRLLRAAVSSLLSLALLACVVEPAPADAGSRVPSLRPPVDGRLARLFEAPADAYAPGHRGVDFSAGLGAAVRAPATGDVTVAGPVAGLIWVTIQVSPGVLVTVGPLSDPAVTPGARLAAGATLGRLAAGHDGFLHLGLRVDGVYVDPLPFIADLGRPRLAPLPVPQRPTGPPGGDGGSLGGFWSGPPSTTPSGIPPAPPTLRTWPPSPPATLSGPWRDPVPLPPLGHAPVLPSAPATGPAAGNPAGHGTSLPRAGAKRGTGAGWLTRLGERLVDLLRRPPSPWTIQKGGWRLGTVGASALLRNLLRQAFKPPVLALTLATWPERRVLGAAWTWLCAGRTLRPAPAPPNGNLAVGVAGIDTNTLLSRNLDIAGIGYRPQDIVYFSYRGLPLPGRQGLEAPYARADSMGDIRAAAFRLADQLRQLHAERPGMAVDIVAHSQGGIVAAYFLAYLDDPADPTLPRINHLVTISSPHQGADFATTVVKLKATRKGRAFLWRAGMVLRLFGIQIRPDSPAVAQLAEGSVLLRQVGGRPLPTTGTAIRGGVDIVVPGPHAARAEFNGQANCASHGGGLRDGRARAEVISALADRPLPPAAPGHDLLPRLLGNAIDDAEHGFGWILRFWAGLPVLPVLL